MHAVSRVCAPWTIYASERQPTSSVGTLLSIALLHQVILNDGFGPDDIAGLAEPTLAGARVRDAVESAIALFMPPLQDGRFITHARPVGGGALRTIPASHWELDDPTHRFALSAYAFDRPFDSDAEPTHWIFADQSVEQAIYDLHRSRDGGFVHSGGDAEGVPSSVTHASTKVDRYDITDKGFLRRPQVEALVGLKKSAIYQRIEEGSFPASQPIGGGRATGWRRADIEKWLDEQQ